jgi:phosphoenolpyruvate-protein phosphotransferase
VRPTQEASLHGVSAAPGISVGPALVLAAAHSAQTGSVNHIDRAAETKRAREALELVAKDLDSIAIELRRDGRGDDADIVETGILMAMDPELIARVEALIVDGGLLAPDALREAAEQTALELSALDNEMLAQRADDVRSVGRRAAAHLNGVAARVSDGVLIADTLGPADVAELAPTVRGIALAGGGVTAHAAIVARSLGLPMVVGAGPQLLEIEDGEEVLVDGDRGVVVRHPDADRAALAHAETGRRHSMRADAIARRLDPAETTDGHRIRVLANASTVAELQEALQQGAEGVGLMRTELLFLEATRWPSHAQQVKVLRPVLAGLSGQTATVRLFDFGGDKTPPFLKGIEARGIEVLMGSAEQMQTHLAAVVEAARGTRLRLLVPMVMSAEDMRAVRKALAAVLAGGDPPLVGAMIETPEAAAASSEIAAESDFLSIGTNDLTQLVLGLDREQSRKAPVMDARVLTLIMKTVEAAHDANIPVDVCGEAASDAKSLPVMVGFGVDELSVAAARVGQVRQWIRELSYETSRAEARGLLDQAGHASGERV